MNQATITATATAALAFASVLYACTADTPDATDTADSTAEGEAIEIDATWVMGAEGAWLGHISDTPYGTLDDFPLDFIHEEDGSLHARTSFGDDTGYFDFRFREQDGTWVLDEEGKFPGGLLQSYTLHPVEQANERVRFETLEMPGFILVDVIIEAESLVITAQVNGELHATFDLQR